MIAVDSSAWIGLLHGHPHPVVAELKARIRAPESVAIVDVVLTEVLRGCRSDAHAAEVGGRLRPFPVLRLQTLDDFRRAAALYRTARRAGVTVRSTVDCLIASVCIREDVPLLHADADFDRLASVSPLRVVPLG